MAEISFSISDLFEQAFGYKTNAFSAAFSPLPSRVETSATGAPYYADDLFGREYFMPATLTYSTDLSGNGGNSGTSPMKQYTLPYPVISIACSKTIIETPLTDRRGTVKELISIRDYDITIKGLIINNTDDFPENDVATLRAIFEQNGPVQLKCALTDIFLLRPDRSGSDAVVIRDLVFPPLSGIKNVRPYEMKLLSDEAFNLVDIS